MALLGLFGKGPLSEKKIQKLTKLASNPFAQPDVRMREMMRLIGDGSDAALKGVLKRFASNANGHIADEEEKQWLEDKLVDLGQDAILPLEHYIANEEKLTYALRAYRRLVGNARAADYFSKILQAYGPADYRGVESKLQLVWQLAELLEQPGIMETLIPFLRDHSDDVAWAVMEIALAEADANRLNPEIISAIAAELGALVADDAVAPRMQQRAAEILCEKEWQVGSDVEALAPSLDDTYFLDKKQFVRRRAKGRT